jgi:hypothetical protein
VIIMFSGALLVELAKNLIGADAAGGGAAMMQVVLEEFLEMIGVTVIIWAAYDLVVAHGFALSTPLASMAAQVSAGVAEQPSSPRLEPVTRLTAAFSMNSRK